MSFASVERERRNLVSLKIIEDWLIDIHHLLLMLFGAFPKCMSNVFCLGLQAKHRQ